METQRLKSSIERYKSKIHHLEFKTSELEATLNRKDQMITKLQKDLEEVTDYFVTILFVFFNIKKYFYFILLLLRLNPCNVSQN